MGREKLPRSNQCSSVPKVESAGAANKSRAQIPKRADTNVSLVEHHLKGVENDARGDEGGDTFIDLGFRLLNRDKHKI